MERRRLMGHMGREGLGKGISFGMETKNIEKKKRKVGRTKLDRYCECECVCMHTCTHVHTYVIVCKWKLLRVGSLISSWV